MKKTFLSLFIVLTIGSLFSNSTIIKFSNIISPADSNEYKKVEELFSVKDEWVEKTLSEMSIEEKAAQLVFPYSMGYGYDEGSSEFKFLKHLVRDRKVGGILFFTEDMYGQVETVNKLQRISKIPLMITADFEKGISPKSIGTVFPSGMGIGAADDIRLTYEMGRIISKEARSIGVHQNYSPVVDVNNNPLNPIINTRSYGEDVELVKRLSSAMIKGLQDGGMLATVKHFPGHGNTSTDSHNEIPFIKGNRESLEKTEFAPFRNGINNGVMSVMVGHLSVPEIDKDKLPATLSKRLVGGLLIKEMKFKGLIVTDAMDMHAVTKKYKHGKAAAMAILAGIDIVLMPADPDKAIDGIIDAVESGEISIERLNHSVRKVLLAKKYAGLDKNNIVNVDEIKNNVGLPEHWRIANLLAEKSITLVKDEDMSIPMRNEDGKKYLNVSVIDSKDGSPDTLFNDMMKKRLGEYSSFRFNLNSDEEEADSIISNAGRSDVVIISVYSKVRPFAGNIGLSKLQIKLVKDLILSGKEVILTSHGNPYILSEFSNTPAYLCNYGDNVVVERALVKAMFGETDITGTLPVSIPGTYFQSGNGLSLKGLRESRINQPPVPDYTKVDSLMENAVKDTIFPGGVLMILKDGEVIHTKTAGCFTYDKKSTPFTLNTVFDLASVSKVIATTTAVMLCVDRGLIKLDEKVCKYIPEFSANGKGKITVKNLMVHNSGLPSGKNFYKPLRTAEQVINEIFNEPLVYETGTKTVYSDLGMITVGKIIEKVTGKTLDKFCKDEIFIPLGMKNTCYNPSKDISDRIAPTEYDNYWRKRQLVGEVHDEAASILNGVAGHAGLFSTAGDLSIILQMLLDKGVFKGKQFIKSETVEYFIKQNSPLSSRGIGWDTKAPDGSSCGPYFSPNSYGHTGYTGTSVWTDPERKLIVILLTNRVQPTRENTKIIKFRPIIHSEIIDATDEK